MALGAPQGQTGPDEEYTEEAMFERLQLASGEFRADMSLLDAWAKAESLVNQGLLVRFTYQSAGIKEEVYYVPGIQGGPGAHGGERRHGATQNRVFSLEQSPNLNGGHGSEHTAYQMNWFDHEGRVARWIRKLPDGLRVIEEGTRTCFPNGNDQRVEIYRRRHGDNSETSLFEYAEGDPENPIFHKVTDNKTGAQEIKVDRRR